MIDLHEENRSLLFAVWRRSKRIYKLPVLKASNIHSDILNLMRQHLLIYLTSITYTYEEKQAVA